MTQLFKGMYDDKFGRPSSDLFELRFGQIRRKNNIVHNGYWYNRQGEYIGWGDLCPEDFVNISNEIDDDELFIVLHKSDHSDMIKSMIAANPDVDVEAPGIDRVAEKCCYIIARDQMYYVDDSGKDTMEFQGLQFKVLKRNFV